MSLTACHRVRRRLILTGIVQGIGFRPTVCKKALDYGLTGWVSNSNEGVQIEIQGAVDIVEHFTRTLSDWKPRHSRIDSFRSFESDPIPDENVFVIRKSIEDGKRTAIVSPDIAACPDCLEEIHDPNQRRYRYPFTNCTQCGPRLSIIREIPYDRGRTTMAGFSMCMDCRNEFEDFGDRRFHAQPIACAKCGPRISLLDRSGRLLARDDEALEKVSQSLVAGAVVALKGLGGFHLLTPAGDDASVQRLRKRKQRSRKPFALMFPSLSMIGSVCELSELEKALLRSPQAPIVIVNRFPSISGALELSSNVAPDLPWLGCMLPYTPLHHLILDQLQIPLVATSGNLSEEPICIDNDEALFRLKDLVDYYLMHDRPIARPVEDSVVRVIGDRPCVYRRSRGYAPIPFQLKDGLGCPYHLAAGPHLKNTVTFQQNGLLFTTPHIGDLESCEALRGYVDTIKGYADLFFIQPQKALCDAHPDYLSSRYAGESFSETKQIQHHVAHIASLALEHAIEPPFLGVAWDGTGYGPDGVSWGSEFFHVTADYTARRAAHFKPWPLPGGDTIIKSPARQALAAWLYWFHPPMEKVLDSFIQEARFPSHLTRSFRQGELQTIWSLIRSEIHCPFTTSAGRLFDLVSALLNLRVQTAFEGDAAMQVEWAASRSKVSSLQAVSPLFLNHPADDRVWLVDWAPFFDWMGQAPQRMESVSALSRGFQDVLVGVLVEIAERVGERKVLLSGGCFQNKLLVESAAANLEAHGFHVFTHQDIPPNDGGISLGQFSAWNWKLDWKPSRI